MNNSLKELFLEACQKNDLDRVKASLTLDVDVNTVSEDGQLSGLTIAAWKNYPKLLDLLLSQPGIDVNLTTTESVTGGSWGNWTPLMFACYAGHHQHHTQR